MRRLPAPAVLALSYLCGAIPFSNLVAHRLRHVDLRSVGTGTVSGSGLYRIAGFGPLALAGTLDVAKGAVGPLLAGRERPLIAGLAGGAAVAGHDWSPFLRGAGGRGLSTALGALLVNGWEGVVVLSVGLAGGKLAKRTSIGCFIAYLALVPVLRATRGPSGMVAGGSVVVPLLVKRVLGNRPAVGARRWRIYLNRLVLDQDQPRRR
ncbi:MAG TPA: glycerol-3-phosphate acyltransferase [Actinomycetota bacterium]|nr:glycerol-3-phosphate acyltransferase [Actinomycetota bacterium]